MALLRQFAAYGSLALIAGFLVIAAWKLLTGAISLDGLLDSFDDRRRRQSSPGRLQLLLFTLFVAVQYLAAVWKNPGASSLPAVPQAMLAALAGSQAVYLSGKALSTYLPLLKKLK